MRSAVCGQDDSVAHTAASDGKVARGELLNGVQVGDFGAVGTVEDEGKVAA